jgi:adenosylcobinamide-GDP ribazoletransferase
VRCRCTRRCARTAPLGHLLIDGIRLAFGTLTVVPVRAGRVDRAAAAVAMSIAPLVGAFLGAVLAAILAGLTAAGAPRLVAAAVSVAAGALLTRGLHLDGLADTVDALGSYRRGADALAVMKAPDVGPFGVAAIVLTLLIQAAALTALPLVAVVVAWSAGRLAVPLACRRGVPAARSEGLGALVAGTVPVPALAAAAVAVAVAAIPAVPGRMWQGPAAVVAATLIAALVVRHCVRRFGGVTGDVIGGAVEVATTSALVLLTLT